MNLPTFGLKTKQQLFFWGFISLGGLVIMGLIWALNDDETVGEKQVSLQETDITTVGQRINPQEVWVERIQSDHKLTQGKLKALEELLMTHIKASNEIQDKLERLREAQPHSKETSLENLTDSPHFLPAPVESPLPTQGLESSQGVRKIVLKLSSKKTPGLLSPEKKTLENTIPAGTFAKAVLLGGVDASTSINAQSDPRPVLLRIIDHGKLPRRFQSDLKACHVLASSYGDLSSERVYMRLEKLTCTERLTGEISETEVAGYIVGEDGRAGVRGVVADRAGPMIRNSLLGGFLSGISNFFGAQQQSAVFPVSPLGQRNALNPSQMLGAGAANGASTALDKYAEFFIKRAEQLQPVLQVAAGRAVDIVFTQGTSFGETHVKKTLAKIRDRSRQQAVRKLEEKSDSKDWLPNLAHK